MKSEDINKLNNLLLDEQNKESGVNLKKIIIIGLLLFAVSVGIFVAIDMVNKDNNFKDSLIETTNIDKDLAKRSKIGLEFDKLNLKNNNEIKEDKKDPAYSPEKLVQELEANKEKKFFAQTNNPAKQTGIKKGIREFGKNQNKKPVTTPVFKKKSLAKKATGRIQRGFYIQVGAFYTTKPTAKFLQKIDSLGYGYVFYKLKINTRNVTKVLIGAYQNKNDALTQMSSIKKSLEKNAFILKIN